ncbi:hypothetical protein FWF48_02280 [Candidatus Saccharibacteria bacterium]|nr:hypothetical protein [Candidatus Saccharibacteria bacterium]
MKIKQFKISLAAATLVLGVVGTLGYFAAPALAADTATSQIEVVVPASRDINAVNPGSGGIMMVDRADFNITFTVRGTGLVTITDQNGNVLYTYNKTDPTEETIDAPITLTDGPGTHHMTLSLFDPVLGIVSDHITIIYKATVPLPPPTGPSAPNTGFIKIGSQEYSVANISLLGAIMAVLAIVVVVLKKQEHKQYKRVAATKA